MIIEDNRQPENEVEVEIVKSDNWYMLDGVSSNGYEFTNDYYKTNDNGDFYDDLGREVEDRKELDAVSEEIEHYEELETARLKRANQRTK